MNQDIEKVWRDEANKYFDYSTYLKILIGTENRELIKGEVIELYLCACKERNEEIENLEDAVRKWYREWYNCEVQRAKLEKEIAQLKLKLELAQVHIKSRDTLLDNNSRDIADSKKLNLENFIEINQLKEELKSERKCVDFYAGRYNWKTNSGRPFTVSENGNFMTICGDFEQLREGLNNRVGGKRARETQSKRKCEIDIDNKSQSKID